jgi:hypothetical protein
MNFAYRPTPVVVLSGWDPLGEVYYPYGLPVAVDPRKRWYGYGFKGDTTYPRRCGQMDGYTPNMASPALNAIGRRTLRGDPWIIRSGNMGKFLGQDDDDGGLDFSTAFAPVSLPAPALTDVGAAPSLFDYSGASAAPIVPTATLTLPGAAPSIGAPILPAGSGVASLPAIANPAAPSAAAGTLATSSPSIIQQIANLFKPTTTTTPMTAAQPGVYQSTTTTPSWFNQSTLVAGTPNSTVLFFGVAALVALAVLGGKK